MILDLAIHEETTVEVEEEVIVVVVVIIIDKDNVIDIKTMKTVHPVVQTDLVMVVDTVIHGKTSSKSSPSFFYYRFIHF
jgi:hypothetical protein